jgi:hypothetical protein
MMTEAAINRIEMVRFFSFWALLHSMNSIPPTMSNMIGQMRFSIRQPHYGSITSEQEGKKNSTLERFEQHNVQEFYDDRTQSISLV